MSIRFASTWIIFAHELARIEALGGEGLMLRQPESRYEVGRSVTLLKVKNFHDAEARVLEHLEGKAAQGAASAHARGAGRRNPVLGRNRFSDAERPAPPPVGSVITFRRTGAFRRWRSSLPI